MKKKHNIDVLSKENIKQNIYHVNIVATLNRQFELKKARKQRELIEHLTRTIDKETLEFLYLR